MKRVWYDSLLGGVAFLLAMLVIIRELILGVKDPLNLTIVLLLTTNLYFILRFNKWFIR